ncbi:TPA: hypothetical protein ACG7B3_004835, partial [Escherichia coli]
LILLNEVIFMLFRLSHKPWLKRNNKPKSVPRSTLNRIIYNYGLQSKKIDECWGVANICN